MAKNKKGKVIKLQPLTLKQYIKEHARKLPIRGCYTFGVTQGLSQIYLVREKRNGNVIVGFYLVDAYCLGLKNTFFNEFESFDEFYDAITSEKYGHEALQEMDIIYAQNLIYGAIEFAEDAGFEPEKDFAITECILDDVETLEFINIEFGQNGKYAYWEGPNDNSKKILATLDKNIGKGNYNYVSKSDFFKNLTEDAEDEDDNEEKGEIGYPEKYFEEIDDLDELSQKEKEKVFLMHLQNIDNEAKVYYGLVQITALGLFDLWRDENNLQVLYKNNPKEIILKSAKYFEDKFENSSVFKVDLEILVFCLENLIKFDSPSFTLLGDFVNAVEEFQISEPADHFNPLIFDFLMPNIYKRNTLLFLLLKKIAKILYEKELNKLNKAEFEIVTNNVIEFKKTFEITEQVWMEIYHNLEYLKFVEEFLPNETDKELFERLLIIKENNGKIVEELL